MKGVMASNNAHKIAELRAILSAYGLDVVSQREAGVHVEPEETGTTFEENSRIKAVAVMQACGLPAVADDSGLMVDALNGEPGVYSARYGGPDCISDSDRINYLLKKLENVPEGKRTAKFVSVITLVTPDGKEIVARGECPGHILFERHGTAASAMIRCSLRRMPGARSQNWPRSRKIRYPTAPGRCVPLWRRRLERKRRRNYADQQTARRSARTGK